MVREEQRLDLVPVILFLVDGDGDDGDDGDNGDDDGDEDDTGDDVLLWLKARTSKLMDLCLNASLVFTWLNDIGQVT